MTARLPNQRITFHRFGPREALIAAGLLGAAIRLRQYFSNRSLWVDESYLALNLIHRDASQLLGRLDFNQGAPPAFLLVEKAVEAAGRGEASLRFPPLVFGLAILVVAVPVVVRICSTLGAVAAYGLIALSPALVYYSSEVKQYSGDTLCALVVTWATLELARTQSRRTAIIAAVVGVGAVVLSYAAVFVVAGQGLVLVGDALVRRRLPARAVALAVATWALAAGLVVIHTVRTSSDILSSLHSSGVLSSGGTGSGATGPVGRTAHATRRIAVGLFGDLGLPTTGLAFKLLALAVGAIGVVGVVAILRTRPLALLIVAMPAIVTLAASATDHYPAFARTVLFLVPAACIALGEGVAHLVRRFGRAGPVVGVATAALVLAYPVHTDAHRLRFPTKVEELRPVLNELASEIQPGDRVYVTHGAQYAFAYYAWCDCTRVPSVNVLRGAGGPDQNAPALADTSRVLVQPFHGYDNASAYLAELQKLPPGRTWLIVSHYANNGERAFLNDQLPRALAERGNRLTTIRAPGAFAILYALR